MCTRRCPWAKNPLDIEYHDKEWGKPLHDDKQLFEMLILEGMQAGLSWTTILKKREDLRAAFDGFDAAIISQYTQEKIESLLLNEKIIRNRLKINSVITNAKAYLKIKDEYGSFDSFIWSFVDEKPIVNTWEIFHEVPASTNISERMSKDLLKKGFKFVGPTICYAYMQAIGMVNDHLTYCEQYGNCLKRN